MTQLPATPWRPSIAALILAVLLSPPPLAAQTGAAAPDPKGAAPAVGAADADLDDEDAEPAKDSSRLLGETRALLAQGNVTGAKVALKLLLRNAPNNPEALSLLADIDLLLRRGGPAEVVLQRAITLGLPREEALARLGQAYLQQRQPQQVLAELAPPGDDPAVAAAVLAVQAQAQVQLGNRAAAAALLAEALGRDPDNLAALTGTGLLALANGERDGARAALERAVAAHADAHEALAVLAEMDQQDGRLAEAQCRYTAALQLSGRQWLYRFKRALVRIDLGDLEGAGTDLDGVESAFPEFVGLNLGRGSLALAQGRPDAALDALESYLTIVPRDQTAFRLAIRAAGQSGNRPRIYALAKRLQREAPGSAGPALVTAEALLAAGDGPGALEVLAPVAAMAQQDPDVALLRVRVLLAANQGDEAQRALQDAVGRFPGHSGLAVQRARGLYGQGSKAPALAAVDTVLKQAPADLDARALRAQVLLDLKRPQEALADGQALVDAAPNRSLGYRVVAAASLAVGDQQGARTALTQAVQRAPDEADLRVSLARLEIEAGNLEQGVARYREALALDPNERDALAGLARWDKSAGEDPLAPLQQTLAREPNNPALRADLIAGLLARGQVDEAQRLADATPTDLTQGGPPRLARVRAVAYLDAKRPADALDLLLPLLAAAPQDAELAYLVARGYAAQGDSRARRYFLDGWRLDPRTPLAGAVLTQVLTTLPDQTQQEALAKDLARLQPDSTTPERLRALIAADRGDLKQAVTRWRGLHTKAPDDPQTFQAYLRALLAADQGAEAQALATNWSERHPQDWGVSLLVANFLAGKNRPADAALWYRRVLAAAPDNVYALNNLALHLASSDPQTALGYAEQALRRYPDRPPIMDTVGTVRRAAGDATGAVEILTRAHEAAPTDPGIAFHLAQALAATGETQRAAGLLREVVSVRFAEQSEAQGLLARLGNH
ncbi:XrtA/PEP-CTERM system TPR-repeat protein PrsT [Candidatus Thiodictyon syntrophicum]|jgi:putative PEP-CTERM system TPR-repeat lipoprotein|nr:XrtA/PEP-CTERM system TPR-repeat protein PrsT [Candidatus Thiodictyon syntrophicum]